MKYFLNFLFFTSLFLLITLPAKTALSDYDYVLGQKLTPDDIEPPDNYDLQVFLEENKAIEAIFKDCDEVVVDKLTLKPQEKKLLEDQLRRELDTNSFNVYIGKKNQRIEKYAIITDERGCFHPITFITGVKQNGKIDKVAVMVYRESRGQEVTRARFLHQYNGKTVDAPIRLNKDIIHITGATTSVRGINRGVRKTLAIIDLFYLHGTRDSAQIPYAEPKSLSEDPSNNDKQLIFPHAFYALDDIVEVLITGATESISSKAFKEVSKEVKRLDKIFNKNYKKSELYRINQKAGKKPVECSSELINVIRSTIHYSEITDGDFDITEGPLSDKLQKKTKKKLNFQRVESLVNAASYKNIVFDKGDDKNERILLKEKLTNIDTLLVSKGYVVDKTIDVLKNNGISNALVYFGGNLRAIGKPPGYDSWKIAIPNPEKSDKSLGYAKINDKAIAISGEYEKKIIKNRKELSEIHEIKHEKYIDSDLINTIVIAPTAFEADTIAAIANLSKIDQNTKIVNEMSGIGVMNLRKEASSNVEIQLTGDIKNYFTPIVEDIETQRTKPACAF